VLATLCHHIRCPLSLRSLRQSTQCRSNKATPKTKNLSLSHYICRPYPWHHCIQGVTSHESPNARRDTSLQTAPPIPISIQNGTWCTIQQHYYTLTTHRPILKTAHSIFRAQPKEPTLSGSSISIPNNLQQLTPTCGIAAAAEQPTAPANRAAGAAATGVEYAPLSTASRAFAISSGTWSNRPGLDLTRERESSGECRTSMYK
jgi:hypothetical protein